MVKLGIPLPDSFGTSILTLLYEEGAIVSIEKIEFISNNFSQGLQFFFIRAEQTIFLILN
jgi:hypothetical protein